MMGICFQMKGKAGKDPEVVSFYMGGYWNGSGGDGSSPYAVHKGLS